MQMINHLWQSTLFTVAAAVLTLALRKNRAHVRYWLWFGASLKFLVPFSLLMGIGSHLVWAPTAQKIAVRIAPSAVSSRVIEISQPFTGTLPAAPAGSGVAWAPIAILAVWACGLACVVVIRIRGWLRIRAAVRASEPLQDGRELEAFRHLRGAEEKARQTGRSAPLCAGAQWGRPPGLPSVKLVSSAARLEPGVFGILRPALWLPKGIGDRLSDAQLEAVLAHELCHVGRRDNLTAAIHMAVEALFWFHPLVWWIGARLVEERERACDEAVAQLGSDPKTYAESILKVCEFYAASPLACAAGVTGADLKKRIEGIMTNRLTRKLSLGKKALLAAAAALAIVGPIAVGLMNPPRGRAQTEGAAAELGKTDLQFEAASIKHSDPNRIGRVPPARVSSPGRYIKDNISLAGLAMDAYGLKESYQIDWKFSWMQTEFYDVAAKVPAGATKEQVQIMVQRLLAERFGLVVHRETRELPGYRLLVAKGGAKLKKSLAAPAPAEAGGVGSQSSQPPRDVIVRNGTPQLSDTAGTGALVTLSGTTLRGRHENMAALAHWLAGPLHEPVVDATGLEGEYDYDLSFAPLARPLPKDSVVVFPPGAAATPPANLPPSPYPTLWSAIKEQLGLQLEPVKAIPVEVLVLEKANREPTEN